MLSDLCARIDDLENRIRNTLMRGRILTGNPRTAGPYVVLAVNGYQQSITIPNVYYRPIVGGLELLAKTSLEQSRAQTPSTGRQITNSESVVPNLTSDWALQYPQSDNSSLNPSGAQENAGWVQLDVPQGAHPGFIATSSREGTPLHSHDFATENFPHDDIVLYASLPVPQVDDSILLWSPTGNPMESAFIVGRF